MYLIVFVPVHDTIHHKKAPVEHSTGAFLQKDKLENHSCHIIEPPRTSENQS